MTTSFFKALKGEVKLRFEFGYLPYSNSQLANQNRVCCPDIRCDFKSLTWSILPRYHAHLAEFGYNKFLIVWVFWRDVVSPKYEPRLDQTRLIYHRSAPERYNSKRFGGWNTCMTKHEKTILIQSFDLQIKCTSEGQAAHSLRKWRILQCVHGDHSITLL